MPRTVWGLTPTRNFDIRAATRNPDSEKAKAMQSGGVKIVQVSVLKSRAAETRTRGQKQD